MDHVAKFSQIVAQTAQQVDVTAVDNIAKDLKQLRDQGGRLFILGVGGGAGNAGHAACDFRKLCNIETYAPSDNISELTARANDEGWDTIFSKWLQVSKFNSNDAIFILSVGGGSAERNVSPNLIKAIDLAKSVGAKIYGVVGRDGGYTAKHANHVVIIPTIESELVTPVTEAFQGVIWHCLVSHPVLQVNNTKW